MVESLSKNDGDGYENITWKVNLCCFKLYRFYSILFNPPKVGKFFWSWILKDCIEVEEMKRKSSIVSTSYSKREIRHFDVVVVQRRQRNVQKSVMHVQSCKSNDIAFLPFSLPLPSSMLKLPFIGTETPQHDRKVMAGLFSMQISFLLSCALAYET